MNKVVVVTNIPRPYRLALFGVLGTRLASEDLGLQVLYTSDPSKHVRRGAVPAMTAGSTAETYVPGLALRGGYERVISIPTGLGRALKERRPVCVVAGGFGPSAMVSGHWCRGAKVPHVIWSGGWPGHEGKVGLLKTMARRRMVGQAAAFVAYGSAAMDYLVALGAPPEAVFPAWNTVDLEGFASAAREAAARRSELSGKYGLAAKNLLFVGSLVARKGLRELVSAALAAQPPDSGWALHLVGGGPLEEELRQTVRAAGKEDHFRFHGLRPEADVVELLGVADGFILPTKQEAWGLVINEAMACGVPVVASPQAGATRDLIQHGVTGYVVEPTDRQALAAIITLLLSDDTPCKAVGRAGAEAVRAKASLARAADGFVSAVLYATKRTRVG